MPHLSIYNAVVKPKIKLIPASGTVGSIITISGEGFGKEEPIGIDFGSAAMIATTNTGAKGSFATTFKVNTQFYGTKTVAATGSISGFLATDIFFIDPRIIMVTPTSGSIGVKITVTGDGFGEAEGIEIDFGQTLTITTTTATPVGTFETMFTVDTQPAGVKTITAKGMTTLAIATAKFTITQSQPLPDLVVTGISFYPSATVELGKGVKIGAIITNHGDAIARGIMVRYYDGEIMIGRDKVIGGSLAPGETKEKKIHWKAGLPIGTHTIRVVVDPENTIIESNENNNEGHSILVVVLPPDKGAISGTVMGVDNTPIAEVVVSICGNNSGIDGTNIDGKYIIGGLTPGKYMLSVFKQGYFPEVKKVTILAGKVSYDTVSLRSKAGKAKMASPESRTEFDQLLPLFAVAWDGIESKREQLTSAETEVNFEALMSATVVWNWATLITEDWTIPEDREVEKGSKTTVRLTTEIADVSSGQEFEVKIIVDMVEDLMGANLWLRLDPEILEIASISESDFLTKNGGKTRLFTTIDNELGIIKLSIVAFDSQPMGITGSGEIATIKAIIRSAGLPCRMNWVECDMRNSFNEKILSSTRGFAINQSTYQDLRQAHCYPNPTTADSIIFDKLPYNTDIRIFNIAGELVYSMDDFNGDAFSRTWDCRNNSGDKLASGIYIYMLKDQNGNTKRGKLGMVR